MTRSLSCAVLLLLMVEVLPAAPVPTAPTDPTKDRQGNPLPKGATARLGSLSYRGPTTSRLSFSRDGKRLYAVKQERMTRWDDGDDNTEKKPEPKDGKLLVWDAETGRLVDTRAFAPAVPANCYASSCVAGDRIVTLLSEEVLNKKGRTDYTVKVFVAAAADGKEITHFDLTANTPRQAREFDFGYEYGTFRTASVSPDGRYLVIYSSSERSIVIYDLDREKMVHNIQTEGPTTGVYITPDSKSFFVNQDRLGLGRYELASGKALPAFAEGELRIYNLAVSPDGKRAVTNSVTEVADPIRPRWVHITEETHLVVRDADGKSTGKISAGGPITNFKFIDSERVLLIYNSTQPIGESQSIALWNAATLKREWERTMPRGMNSVLLKVSPDGKQFALASSNVIFVGDAATGKSVVPTATHTGPVKWIGFSPDGKTVTTAGGEEIFVWALNGEPRQLIEVPELARNRGRIPTGPGSDYLVWTSCSPEGKTEIIGWDREKPQIAWRMPYAGKPETIFTHDGKRVVVLGWDAGWEDWQASVYDAPRGKLLDDWTVPYMPPHIDARQTLQQLENQLRPEFGPGFGGGGKGMGGGGGGKGGNVLPKKGPGAGAGIPFQVHQQLTELSQMLQMLERNGPNYCHPVTLSGDGNTIFVAGSKVVALDALTGRKKTRVEKGSLDPALASEGSLAASADGSLLAVADANSLRVIDVKTGQQVMSQGDYSLHLMMKFSPDGKQLAAWSLSQQRLLVFDVEAKKPIPRVFDGGLTPPSCCAFNAAGTSLAVGYADGTSLIWNLNAK